MGHTETRIIKYGNEKYGWVIEPTDISYLRRKGEEPSLYDAWEAVRLRLTRMSRQIFDDNWEWVLLYRDMSDTNSDMYKRYYGRRIMFTGACIVDAESNAILSLLNENAILSSWDYISIYDTGILYSHDFSSNTCFEFDERLMFRYGGSLYTYEDRSSDRQKEIVTWLEYSDYVLPFNNKNGFYLVAGTLATSPFSKEKDIFAVLKQEGFLSIKHILNYNIVYTPPGKVYREKLSFFDGFQGQSALEIKEIVNNYKERIQKIRDAHDKERKFEESCMPDPNWSDSRPIDYGLTDKVDGSEYDGDTYWEQNHYPENEHDYEDNYGDYSDHSEYVRSHIDEK